MSQDLVRECGPVVQPGILATVRVSGQRTSGLQTDSRSRDRKVAGSNPARSTKPQDTPEIPPIDTGRLEIQEKWEIPGFVFPLGKIRDRPKAEPSGRRLYILDFLLFFFLATSFAVRQMNQNLLKRYSHMVLTCLPARFFFGTEFSKLPTD